MPATPAPLPPQPGDLLVLVGTMKGAFLYRTGAARDRLDVSGPHFPGAAVYALGYDDRAGRQRLWASASNAFFGTHLRWSDDFGATWADPVDPLLSFPEETGAALANVWQIALPANQPDVVYAGTEPAALFRSADGGASFELVRGLWDHPHREKWEPGGGGLGLHTILPHPADPDRVLVAISTGGVYQTEDGGKSWTPTNRGIRADFLPAEESEWGQCVHKVSRSGADPDRLFLQNHGGLYRSDDGGRSWNDIGNGVPSDFGFPMVAHPRATGTAYCIPLESPGWRCTPDGRMRVYRTTDAGASWQPLTGGLPQQDAHLTILRDGFTHDPLEPTGLWFGTRDGRLFGSADEGETWREYADGLPPVVCVKTAVIGP